MNKKNTILVLVLILALAIFFITRNKAVAPTGDDLTATSTTTEMVEQTIGGVTFTSPKGSGATIEQVPIEGASVPKPIPALYAPTNYPESLANDARVIISAEVAKRNAILASSSTNVEAWMDLAIYRKMASDYKGAETVWLYVIKLKPDYYVPYANLADLYANYLKDVTKAKSYGDQATKLKPQ